MFSARDINRLAIIAALVLSLTAVSAARTRATSKHTPKGQKGAAATSTHKSSDRKSGAKSATSKSRSAKSRTSESPRLAKNTRGKKGKAVAQKRGRGQQEIGSERALEIQNALIRERYMSGDPSGVMDQGTKSALMKFQSDNGWQTKVVPDARALIKLGLGPSREGLLNPDSAALAVPASLGTEKEIPGGR